MKICIKIHVRWGSSANTLRLIEIYSVPLPGEVYAKSANLNVAY